MPYLGVFISPQTIAICGKGGTGKTTVAALLGLEVAAARRKVLLIDADPPMSQVYALRVNVPITIADMRLRLANDPDEQRRVEAIPIKEVIKQAQLSFRWVMAYTF